MRGITQSSTFGHPAPTTDSRAHKVSRALISTLSLLPLVVACSFQTGESDDQISSSSLGASSLPSTEQLIHNDPPAQRMENGGDLHTWAANPEMLALRLSPNGRFLALIRHEFETNEFEPIIEIYDLESADEMELVLRVRSESESESIQGYDWVSDTTLAFELRNDSRHKVGDFDVREDVFEIGWVDVENKTKKGLGRYKGAVAHVPTDRPDELIVLTDTDTLGGAWSHDVNYFALNLRTGESQPLVNVKLNESDRIDETFNFDSSGTLTRLGAIDIDSGEQVFFYLLQDSGEWREYFRFPNSVDEVFRPVGSDPKNKNHVLVIAHNGDPRVGLWSFDMANKRYGELIFRHEKIGRLNPVYHTDIWNHRGEVAGIQYFSDVEHRVYFDEQERTRYEQIRSVVPNAGSVDLVSRTKDGSKFVVYNRSPRDPGTYYIYENSELTAISTPAPDIPSNELAIVEYIEYESIDGVQIPAYLTKPRGEPPFPLVVLPHDGPHLSQEITFDPWAQLLAYHGFLVLQPQFRGSDNYGLDFLRLSFSRGNQVGRIMQDDKDSGAKYLVEQGLADPNRLAIAGWGYGGYAALIAATREPQVYQCAFAAAPISNPFHEIERGRWYGKVGRVTRMRIWVDALSPFDVAEKINVPLLVFDTERKDNRFAQLLERHGTDYEYVENEGLGRGMFMTPRSYPTLLREPSQYQYRRALYESSIQFLKEGCGTQGL